MIVRKLSHWFKGEHASNLSVVPAPAEQHAPAAFPSSQLASEGLADARSGGSPKMVQSLMEDPDLQAFFRENHFGLGRHNGAAYRTREALDRGRDAVTARFQNAAMRAACRKESSVRKLQDMMLEIEGVSEPTTKRLQQAIGFAQHDRDALMEQADLAALHRGWVREAVLDYEVGFAKGVLEAVAVGLCEGGR